VVEKLRAVSVPQRRLSDAGPPDTELGPVTGSGSVTLDVDRGEGLDSQCLQTSWWRWTVRRTPSALSRKQLT
jgi:hypothetical protein